MNNYRYIAYLRKSTEANERQALSIGKQRDIILESFPNLNIIDWIEESKSAFKSENRPAFDEMLERIKRGEADGIVAWKSNRISRNALDAGRVTDLIEKGVLKDIKFANGNFTNDPEGIKSLLYELADSNFYSANLSRDVREGNRRKRKLGWLTTANLSGYMNQLNPDRGVDGQPEKITVIDPERFPILQKAYRLFLTGEYSVPAVLDIMNNQWGYRTRKTLTRGGKPLSRTSLYHILTNVRYAGKIPDPITGELHDGAYPPMITIDEYNLAQKLLGRRGKPRISQKREFIYKGIAVCGECGCSITAERKHRGKKEYIYYHCTHKSKNHKCKQPSIEESEYNRQLEELFENLTIRKEFEEWGMEAIKEMNDETSSEQQVTANALNKRLQEANQKANRLLNLVADGFIDGEQYKKMNAENEAEITRLQEELNDAINNCKDWRKALEKTLEVLFSGRERFENGDIFVKREVLQSLGSNITLKDKKLHINTYKWLEPIQKEYKSLEDQISKGSNNGLQGKNDPNQVVRTKWRKRKDSNLRDG